ncbi:MAG: phosphatase PAP2 family protein [Clostridia bacterium]|nr:phosphatase PAP2 family protein [Clostridia bacterium]
MAVLYWLESLRVPFLDVFFSAVTHLGEEILFMVIAMTVMWCFDKKQGYYLLIIGLLGTQINQLLKVTFRIERPWVKDPAFTIVESARAEATGYSFPSGHTQCAVGTYGALARWNRQRWMRVLCIAACVLVPLSRMYLGVHTPLDVGVSTVSALVLVFGLYPVIQAIADSPRGMRWMLGILLTLSAAVATYMTVTLSGAPEEELQNGLKTAYKMLGSMAGFVVAYELDVRYIRFETKAVWWAQVLKIVLGLALTLGVKELAYAVFGLIPHEPLNRALSYFVLVVFAGAVWPLTFRFFAKCGQKRT